MADLRRDWEALNGARSAFLMRCERYAGLTQPILFPPIGYNENLEEMENDYQSVGSQAVNNLANKIMLALFAPSRPFFRFDIPDKELTQLAGDKNKKVELESALAVAERNCVKHLEQFSSRPKLYSAIKHLIVTGNVLLILPHGKGVKDDMMRTIGLRNYAVKRNQCGKVIRLIVREKLLFDELTVQTQEILRDSSTRYTISDDLSASIEKWVEHFISLRWDEDKGKYIMTQAVDDIDLTPPGVKTSYYGEFTEDALPYRALTWELADENNYGTGLVEQCAGDLEAISMLSEAALQAAVLASEFRWLVNPAGQTSVQDFAQSKNGDALPGMPNDIAPVVNGGNINLQPMQALNQDYINRIGKTFLLIGSVIRDSERTTAAEVSAVAQELETSLGGVYSRLAVDMQKPIAYWLIQVQGVKAGKDGLEPVIITGMDALSRNGDLELLQMCLADLANLAAINPLILQRLKLQPIIAKIFQARGLDSNEFVLTEEDAQAMMEQARSQDAAVAAAPGVAAQAMRNQGQQGA